MSRRAEIVMSPQEVSDFLGAGRGILQVASLGKDGWPHLVAMWFAVEPLDGDQSGAGQIVFWTYRSSQKITNLRRDPRITVMVESGAEYAELQGVSIKGNASISEDPQVVQRVGEAITARYVCDGTLDPALKPFIAAQAERRVAVLVTPSRVVSWDHRKLQGRY